MKDVVKFPAGLDLGQTSPLEELVEDKSSLIRNRLVLPDIEDDGEREAFKATLIDFFKKHPNYENKIDWNKAKTLTRNDFQQVLDLGKTSRGSQKREIQADIRNIFKSVGDRKFAIVGENSKWLFVAPLTYEAAIYCDSSENQGAGAEWCIGYKKSDSYWRQYVEDYKSLFIMAFNKNYKTMPQNELQTNLKYMIEQREGGWIYNVWTQDDKNKGQSLDIVGTSLAKLVKMFKAVVAEMGKQAKEIEAKASVEVSEILNSVEGEIDEKTIPEKYKKHLSKVEIPASVTKIGSWVFSDCENLADVTIPDTVNEIGNYSFLGCGNLRSLTIPSSVTRIGPYAFAGSGLMKIVIPDSVLTIGVHAFEDCVHLKFVELPASIESIGRDAFWRCDNIKQVVAPKKLKDDLELHGWGLPLKAKVTYK